MLCDASLKSEAARKEHGDANKERECLHALDWSATSPSSCPHPGKSCNGFHVEELLNFYQISHKNNEYKEEGREGWRRGGGLDPWTSHKMFELFTWWSQILPDGQTTLHCWNSWASVDPCSWGFSHFWGEMLEVSGETTEVVWPMLWLEFFSFFFSVLHITYLKNHVESGDSKRKYYKTDIEGKKGCQQIQ